MIRVVRIAGESFDLETGKETPKALVLSNGKTEFSLYVNDETAGAVLSMMLEEAQAPAKPNGSAPVRTQPAARQSPTIVHPPVYEEPAARARQPQMAVVSDDDAVDNDVDENGGFEPGEEYNDPATGAESL